MNDPVTGDELKQELLAMQARNQQELLAMEERIVAALKSYVNERAEEVETKLLTAFHGWGRPHEIKVRATSPRCPR